MDDCGRSHVKYDDGQVEILYFAVERYKLAEPTCNTGALKTSSLHYTGNLLLRCSASASQCYLW